jgi:hypothetical protein
VNEAVRVGGAARPGAEGRGRLPDFLVIGATKCGTTSLHDWLSRHDGAFVSPWKEMRFFLPGHRWERGLDWYAAQFAAAGAAQSCGEFSNGYGRGAEHPGVPARVAGALPGVRLVYVLRDPMRRLASHWRHRIVTGREWRDPAEAIAADPAYLETGRYGAEIERWLAHHPRDRLLVLRAERLFADPRTELARLARHLGLAERPDLPLRRENAAADRRPLPRPLRRAIGAAGAWGMGRRLARGLPDWALGAGRASEVPFELPAPLRARLLDVYEADRAVLRRHVPEADCDWILR